MDKEDIFVWCFSPKPNTHYSLEQRQSFRFAKPAILARLGPPSDSVMHTLTGAEICIRYNTARGCTKGINSTLILFRSWNFHECDVRKVWLIIITPASNLILNTTLSGTSSFRRHSYLNKVLWFLRQCGSFKNMKMATYDKDQFGDDQGLESRPALQNNNHWKNYQDFCLPKELKLHC